tara:strand:- start:62200 stop:63045 length:846 start_codon:yes stop_codon:yes gene_type:complete
MEKSEQIVANEIEKKLSFFDGDKNQGRWKLEHIIAEDQIHKFSLTTLPAYQHPVTGQTYVPSENGRPLSHLVVDKIILIFDPSRNADQKRIIDWLILHPEVKVDGLELSEQQKNNKVKARFKLVNLDMQDLTEMDENNIIDEMVGRLSFAGGPNSVGITKLRYAAAAVGVSYKDKRHANNPDAEKKHLRNKLKKYVRRGRKQAEEFQTIINNVENASRMFAIKVLLDKKEISFEYGIYKYNGHLLGSSLESAVGALEVSPDLHAEMLDKAKTYLREDNFKI